MRSRRLLILGGVLVAGGGCLGVSSQFYSPRYPREAVTPAFAAAMTEVRLDEQEPSIAITLSVSAARPIAIRQAWLSVPAARPCSAGFVPQAIALGGQIRWDRPLWMEGVGSLQLTFAVPDDLLTSEATLDVSVLEGNVETCARLVVADRAPGARLVHTGWQDAGLVRFQALDLGGDGEATFRGDLFAIEQRRIYPRGPFALGLSSGFRFGTCGCLALAPRLEAIVLRGTRRALAAGLSYEALLGYVSNRFWTDDEAAEGTRVGFGHGARASLLLWLRTPPRLLGAEGYVLGSGLELSFAVHQWPGASSAVGLIPTVGLGWIWSR